MNYYSEGFCPDYTKIKTNLINVLGEDNYAFSNYVITDKSLDIAKCTDKDYYLSLSDIKYALRNSSITL